MNTESRGTTFSNSVSRPLKLTVARPAWVCSNRRQGVTIVGDDSPSMTGQKARDATDAILALVGELAEPSNKDAFDVAVVSFDEMVQQVLGLRPATQARGELEGTDLLRGRGSGTNITAGLEEAERIVDNMLAREASQLRPVVLLFSDGAHNTGPQPDAVADRIKQKADLVTVAYDEGDEALLRRLASTPQHFYKCRHGAELRAFMASVGETLTTTMARGMNATNALASMNQ